MTEELLRHFAPVTREEEQILQGAGSIDRDLYMKGTDNRVNAEKLLAAGKLIALRPHTRFIHFPVHTHDYVEVVYMCTGQTTHIVNGRTVVLKAGELLFLNQTATHEIRQAEEGDVAVNFIILPEFFAFGLQLLEEETPLRRFLVDCLCGRSSGEGYLHFQVSEAVPVQNLVENLLYGLLREGAEDPKISRLTMELLFLQLPDYAGTLAAGEREQAAVLRVLTYVEEHYVRGSLTELAELLHYDFYWLSREIKRKLGKTYTQLVQEKRLSRAAYLLRTTPRTVDEIANAVGYENIGYFHRIFRQAYGMSPRKFRQQIK